MSLDSSAGGFLVKRKHTHTHGQSSSVLSYRRPIQDGVALDVSRFYKRTYSVFSFDRTNKFAVTMETVTMATSGFTHTSYERLAWMNVSGEFKKKPN